MTQYNFRVAVGDGYWRIRVTRGDALVFETDSYAKYLRWTRTSEGAAFVSASPAWAHLKADMDTALSPDFDGTTYSAERDKGRLTKQLARVRELMLPGNWMTLGDLAAGVGAPEASVSARLRDLRKPKFGGFQIDREYRGGGLWAYRMSQAELVGGGA